MTNTWPSHPAPAPMPVVSATLGDLGTQRARNALDHPSRRRPRFGDWRVGQIR